MTKTSTLMTLGTYDDFFEALNVANELRQIEYGENGQLTPSFLGNAIGGEVGEVVEVVKALTLTLSLVAAAGKMQNVAKKLDRERLGIKGSRATIGDLANEIADVDIYMQQLCEMFHINRKYAIINKFNATSNKLSMKTLLHKGDEGDYTTTVQSSIVYDVDNPPEIVKRLQQGADYEPDLPQAVDTNHHD